MPESIMMGDVPLPWVDGWNHLGNELNRNDLCWHGKSTMDEDTKNKRIKFIGKYHSLRQEFGFLESEIFFKIINLHATSFYGSNVWALSSQSSERIYTSWNNVIRMTWNLPNITHRYLLEEVSNSRHIKISLFKRYISFINSVRNSEKKSLSALANFFCYDKHSITCQNIAYISKESGSSESVLHNPESLNNIIYAETPAEEKWRIGFLKELIQLWEGKYELQNNFLTNKEIEDLITFIATT